MTRSNIFLIFFLILLLGTGYLWYQYSRTSLVSPEKASEDFEARLAQLRRLKTLKIDVAILEDPFFKSFRSISEVVAPEKVEVKTGRSNPFLPL